MKFNAFLLLAFLTTSSAFSSNDEASFTIENGDKLNETIPYEDSVKYETYEEPRVFRLDFSNARVPLKQIIHTGIVVDEIPTLLQPKKIDIKSAKAEENLTDDDYVVAVDVDGDVALYPLSILNWHQGVNDTINGNPVFVSWDPLSGQPLAIDRRMKNTVTTFGVTGLVYRSTSLYYDKATQSLWSPLIKRAITGAMNTYKMNEYPAFITQVKNVEKTFPNARVLSRKTGYTRDYDTNPYGTYGKDTSMLFPVKYYDNSLPRKEYMLGVTLRRNGSERHVAFPISALLEWRNAKGLKFTLGAEELLGVPPIQITVHYMEPEGRFEVSTPHDDVEVDMTYSYWFVWSAFHPKTHVIRYIHND